MRWIVLALLLAVTSINYLDRLLLSVLSPILRDHFHFSESLYGNINAAFQICYAFGFLASGWLLDKYGVKRGLAAGAALWSVASALHASVTGAAQFGAWRALLGLSEAVNFPACNKAVAEWFPAEQRALATGIFNAGPNLASIIGLGSFAGTLSSVLFSAILPGYLIPLFGYRPLLMTLSFGYIAAVAVIYYHFGDFRPVPSEPHPAPVL